MTVHSMSRPPLQTVAEQVAGLLRSELLAGVFPPGECLREEALAERFGVSRHPVRQVLRQLEQEGLLVAKRHCGMRVAGPPGDHVRPLLTPLRAQIECYALGLALPTLQAGNFASFEPILAGLKFACEQQDPAAILDRDFEFHRHILEVADLHDVIPVWLSIITRMRAFHAEANKSVTDPLGIHYVHAALVEAFQAGPVDRARQALHEHLFNGPFNANAFRRFRARAGRRGR